MQIDPTQTMHLHLVGGNADLHAAKNSLREITLSNIANIMSAIGAGGLADAGMVSGPGGPQRPGERVIG